MGVFVHACEYMQRLRVHVRNPLLPYSLRHNLSGKPHFLAVAHLAGPPVSAGPCLCGSLSRICRSLSLWVPISAGPVSAGLYLCGAPSLPGPVSVDPCLCGSLSLRGPVSADPVPADPCLESAGPRICRSPCLRIPVSADPCLESAGPLLCRSPSLQGPISAGPHLSVLRLGL